MPLEATMLIVDNSEYMRNGDYPPTRYEAQSDAVAIVFETKCDSNPENMVGLMTMAGKAPEILVTSSRHVGQILQGLHSTSSKISGTADIPTAINVAQLALKHRSNKNLRQRIVVFTGSPLDGPQSDPTSLSKLAKKLKKNNIAVDVICFGDAVEEGIDVPVLKTFVDGVNSGDNSHFVAIPPDNTRLLSEVVSRSAVLATDRGDRDDAMADITNAAGGSGTGGEFGDLGVDPNLDPELAMALRMSMEEENARRAAAEANANPTASLPTEQVRTTSESTTQQMPPTPHPIHANAVSTQDASDDNDDDLRQALALSQEHEEDVEMDDRGNEDQGEDEMDEEEAIARAIQMSMPPEGEKE